MNKKRILALTMVLLLGTLTGCSGNAKEESSAPEVSITETSSALESPITASGKFSSMKAFENSDEFQTFIEGYKSSADADANLEITTEGNSLVFTYTFTDYDPSIDLETLTSVVNTAMDSYSSTFEQVAESLKQVIEASDISTIVRYIGLDDVLLCEREFPAE